MFDLNSTIPGAPHFYWREFIRSATATSRGIDNRPPENDPAWERMAYLASTVLEPLRNYFGPIKFNSGYRGPELNAAVGGSASSFHLLGAAADIVPLNADADFTVRDLFSHIYRALPYTELIAEEWPGGWVHVAIMKGREKERQLKYKKVGQVVQRGTYAQIARVFP